MITAFTTAPALHHFGQEREVVIETDVSENISAGVLSEQKYEGVLHPVAYFANK